MIKKLIHVCEKNLSIHVCVITTYNVLILSLLLFFFLGISIFLTDILVSHNNPVNPLEHQQINPLTRS